MPNDIALTDTDLAKVIAPYVHMNGNSKDSLVDEWMDFATAINAARDSLPYDSFHGRNQYPKSEADQATANGVRDLMRAQLTKMHNLAEEVALTIHQG